MPDGMSSENKPQSSIDFMRSLGKPVDLPGAQESLQAAQNFPKPEARGFVPDIRMKLGEENDSNHEKEDSIEAQNRVRYGEGLPMDFISHGERPSLVFRGLRMYLEKLENGTIPDSILDRWSPSRVMNMLFEKKQVLGVSMDEWEDEGIIKDYDPETGTATVLNDSYAPDIAISVRKKQISDKTNPSTDGNPTTEYVYYFGNSKERQRLERAYERASHEFEARMIIGEHIGLRLNLDFRDNLEGMVAMLHSGRISKFKAEHLQSLFNLPDVKELRSNPENHIFGDRLEEAIFLNLVMLNSGTKDKMNALLARPGAQFLIRKMAKEKEDRLKKEKNDPDLRYTEDDWKKEYIGHMDDIEWVEERWDEGTKQIVEIRHTGWAEDIKRGLGTYKQEAYMKVRGKLTQYSNIAAYYDEPGQSFTADKEKDFIENIIGEAVESEEASWLAATFMRVIGAYASEGYVALPNGKSHLPLGEGRYISGDDTGKFWAYMFNYKEGTKGRPSGLKDMIGRIPDMAMNLFDWAQVEIGQEPVRYPNGTVAKNSDGTPQMKSEKRSIWDAWLGTARQEKKDLITGKPTGQFTNKEDYNRLGNLKFDSLDRDFHGTFTIMQWLMGNGEGPVGVLVDALKTNFKPEDFELNELKKKIKYYSIVMNPIVLTKGSVHLYTNGPEASKVIQKNYFRNLMSARFRSASFVINILNSIIKFVVPGKTTAMEVPAVKLIELAVEEAQKDAPKTEEELYKHYIDDSSRLRNAGDITEIEGFLGRIRFGEGIGRVTGRKIIQ